jgi:hypothetical protein
MNLLVVEPSSYELYPPFTTLTGEGEVTGGGVYCKRLGCKLTSYSPEVVLAIHPIGVKSIFDRA